jgi:hypothetical protein
MKSSLVLALAATAAADSLVHRAHAVEGNLTAPMIINGRVTNEGEWEGTVMVIGANGECTDSGLCTGMFIHPVGRFVGLLYL